MSLLNLRSLGATAVLCLASFSAAPALAAPVIADSSFEEPDVGAGGYVYQPAPAGATFNAKAGIADNSPSFGTASDGDQFAFIQSVAGAEGSFGLDVSGLTPGYSYSFVFDAALRAGYPSTITNVSFNGINLGSYDAPSANYTTFATPNFTATGATGVLSFTGSTTITGDDNVRIDNVRVNEFAVTAAPEPATWGLMIVGFGAVGGVLRRRRSVTAVARA